MSHNKDELCVEDYYYLLKGRGGHIKVTCPFCQERRSNKRDKSLSIDANNLLYKCHYCGASGKLKSKMNDIIVKDERYFKPKRKEYIRPTKKVDAKSSKYAESFLEYFKGRGISEETLIKANVTQEIEYFPQLGKKSGCIAFNYMMNGELINAKYRTRNKDFKLIAQAELLPYNIDSINPDAYDNNEPKIAILTEGEADSLTYIECGYKHVISCPNGANANLEWLDDYIDSHFEHLEYIYISVDNDRKGLEFREELTRRFGSDKCRIVDYPEPCKDINEVLCQYGKNEVKKCIDNFTEIRPDGIKELTDVETNLDYLYNHGFEKGITAGIDKLDDILSFKTGMLAIVTGIPSHGKTFALNYILSKINILHDWKMAFFSPEFYPVYEHIAQMAETLGGKRFSKENYTLSEYEQMKKYICNNFFWIDPDDTDITSVLERAKYLIKKKGIKVLVIDPFNALTDKERKTQKQDEYISEFLQKLRWFARKYGIIVFLVAHPTKQQKLENGLYPVVDLYAVKGASEIFDKADIGLTIWRNEQDNYAEIHVTKMKFRHLGEKGFATFRFNINNGRFVTIEDARSLKERGLDMRSMPITWDNSNYILDKIRNQENQISIGFNEDKVEHKTDFMAYSQPQEKDYTDDFFTENNEVPF